MTTKITITKTKEMVHLERNSTPIKDSEVFETSEFLFTFSIKNRPIDDKKVLDFMDKFKTGQNYMKEFPALICSDTWVILDGQHRIEACRRLGIPFFYRWTMQGSNLTIDNVSSVQVNAGWKTIDYVHSFVKQEKQPYIILKRFIGRYNLPVSTAVMLLTGYINDSKKGGLHASGFYNGTLKVIPENEIKAHKIAKRAQEFGKLGFKVHNNRNFVAALVAVTKHPEYDHKQMMDRFEKYGPSMFYQQINTELYIRNLEKLYNYKSLESNRLRFI